MQCQATASDKRKTVRRDVVALSEASLVIGTCRSGSESLIVCVGGLEVSRWLSLLVVWRWVADYLCWWSGGESLIISVGGLEVSRWLSLLVVWRRVADSLLVVWRWVDDSLLVVWRWVAGYLCWWSGGESLIVCVGGLEVSRWLSLLVGWRWVADYLCWWSGGESLILCWWSGGKSLILCWWSGGESLVISVGGVEVSHLSSVLVVRRWVADCLCWWSGGESLIVCVGGLRVRRCTVY